MLLLRFEERMRTRPSMSRGLQATENRAQPVDPPRIVERVHLDKESSFSFLKVGARFEAVLGQRLLLRDAYLRIAPDWVIRRTIELPVRNREDLRLVVPQSRALHRRSRALVGVFKSIASGVRRRALTAATTHGSWRLSDQPIAERDPTLDICNPSLTRKRSEY